MNDLLGGVWMKRTFIDACSKQTVIVLEDLCRQRFRIVERCLQIAALEFAPVDRAILTRLRHACAPVAAAKEAVYIDSGHASKTEQDRLAGEKTVDLRGDRLVGRGIVERVEIDDVEFVGNPAAVRIGAIVDESAVLERAFDQRVDGSARQDTLQRAHADAVVRRHEVEKGRLRRGRSQGRRPCRQRRCILDMKGM